MVSSSVTTDPLLIVQREPGSLLKEATALLRKYVVDHLTGRDQVSERLLGQALLAATEAEQGLAEQRERVRYLEALSSTDELTGLLNRRGFESELERALARADRHGEAGLLILCDLDRFKAVNDTHGHPAGDAVLRAFADLLQRRTRKTDYVSRLGGDEFAVLMTGTTAQRARQRWLKVLRAVEQLSVPWYGAALSISTSFGDEPYGPERNARDLISIADRRLYEHKAARRSRTVDTRAVA